MENVAQISAVCLSDERFRKYNKEKRPNIQNLSGCLSLCML